MGAALTRFVMLDLNETFSKASQGYFEDPDTIWSPIQNIPVLPGSLDKVPAD